MSSPPPIPITKKTDRPECDISKTQRMVDLFAIPPEQRDDNWRKSFLENVPTASFRSDEHQVLNGPDGFPYFVLRLPEPMKPFESYCIQNMKDDFLLHNGWGVVFNPSTNSADWVFSYGDIVNYHLNHEFFTETEQQEIQTENDAAGEQILVAQPSENYLPLLTRTIIKNYLIKIGVVTPKMMLLSRKLNGTIVQELAFNLFKEDYSTQEEMDNHMRPISWLLPRHYILVIVPKDSELAADFREM